MNTVMKLRVWAVVIRSMAVVMCIVAVVIPREFAAPRNTVVVSCLWWSDVVIFRCDCIRQQSCCCRCILLSRITQPHTALIPHRPFYINSFFLWWKTWLWPAHGSVLKDKISPFTMKTAQCKEIVTVKRMNTQSTNTQRMNTQRTNTQRTNTQRMNTEPSTPRNQLHACRGDTTEDWTLTLNPKHCSSVQGGGASKAYTPTLSP